MSNRTRNLVADLNAKLAARQVHSLGEEFYKWFGLTEGDLLEIQRKDGSWQPCTILQVDSCYSNLAGSWTAELVVAKLLRTGKAGTGRRLMVVAVRPGRIRGVRHEVRNPGAVY
jgi:hypothetical protein